MARGRKKKIEVEKAVKVKGPKFDHNELTVIVNEGQRRWLEQAGKKWTYAEFDIPAKKWLPEPKLLDLKVAAELKVLPELQKISERLKEIQKMFSKILPDVELLTDKKTVTSLAVSMSGLSDGVGSLTGEDNGE